MVKSKTEVRSKQSLLATEDHKCISTVVCAGAWAVQWAQ